MSGDLFQFGWFASHSGFQLPFKVDCDHWTDADLAEVAKFLQWKFAFSEVHAVPSDEAPPRTPAGPRLARIMRESCQFAEGYPPMIVDDVLTTGRSMEEFRATVMRNRPAVTPIGFVLVSRAPRDGGAVGQPNWVFNLLRVEEWAQARATGLG
jgi:hypothetical protein